MPKYNRRAQYVLNEVCWHNVYAEMIHQFPVQSNLSIPLFGRDIKVGRKLFKEVSVEKDNLDK